MTAFPYRTLYRTGRWAFRWQRLVNLSMPGIGSWKVSDLLDERR
ncbi:hypothetical protein [Streptomyces prasinus]